MSAYSTNREYDANLAAWSRARDVLAGEDAVKSAGTKYLPRMDSQSNEEFHFQVTKSHEKSRKVIFQRSAGGPTPRHPAEYACQPRREASQRTSPRATISAIFQGF